MGGGAGGKGSSVCSGGGESAIRRRLAGDTVRAREVLVFVFSAAAAAAAAFSAADAFLGETGLLGEAGAEGRPRERTGEPEGLAGDRTGLVGEREGLAGERGFLAGEMGKGGASSNGGAPRGCLDEDRVLRRFWTGSAISGCLGDAEGLEEMPNLVAGPCLSSHCWFLVFLGDVFGLATTGASVSVSVPSA